MAQEKNKKLSIFKTILIIFGALAGLVIIIIIIAVIAGWGTPTFDKTKNPTNQSPVTLSARTDYKNAKIDFYQDGTKTQDLKSDDSGKFSARVDLKEGDNKFKSTATNDKGKTKTSSEINVVYDKTPPILVLSQEKFESKSCKAEISGETEKRSSLTLWFNDKEISNTFTQDGKFKFDVKDLKTGENKYIIKVTDEAGNIGEQKEIVITHMPPTLTLSQANFATDSDNAEISGESLDNSTVTLLISDKEIGKTTVKDSKFKFDVKDLKNGENKFIVKVIDEAGNTGEQKEVVITFNDPKVAAAKLKADEEALAKAKAEAVAKAQADADAAAKAKAAADAEAALPRYREIFSFSGNGPKKSEPFTITGNKFKIKYDCKINSTYGAGICQASVKRVNDEWDMETIMNIANQSVTDETIVYGSGTWYIDSNSSGSYTMTVEDYK